MNYFAHAWVASRVRAAPRFVLGAMLPDLAGFLRIRLPEQRHPEVAGGVALHHATDRAFHELPGFRQRNRSGVRALRALGLARGSARAASHVGIELVLDAALAVGCRSTLGHFGAALGAGECIDTESAEDARAIEQMRERLAGFDPTRQLGATQIAERVRRTLAARPALALRAQDLEPLAGWLHELQGQLAPEAEALARETLRRARAS